jgi:integrase
MDEGNVPLGSIQRILGHENRKTTELYVHSLGDTERRAMAAFEAARQNPKSHTSPTQEAN